MIWKTRNRQRNDITVGLSGKRSFAKEIGRNGSFLEQRWNFVGGLPIAGIQYIWAILANLLIQLNELIKDK